MKIYNRKTGVQGETEVVRFLKQKKYRIIETNYHTMFGEIDIIAQDREILVFIEVKKRLTLAFGRPCEAVDGRKQHKIRTSATCYLKEKRLWDKPCRFDVIEVIDTEMNHIENAF